MLRKGIVALMIGVMSVGSVQATDAPKSSRLMEFLKGPSIGRPNHGPSAETPTSTGGGVTHAVVDDAEKQVPEIRQTSSRPELPQLQPANAVPQPLPVQYGPEAVDTGNVEAPTAQVSYNGTHDGNGLPAHIMNKPARHLPTPGHGMPVVMAPGHGYNGAAGGALYPAPRPGIPQDVGGTLIPNAAFHPSEMIYPHRYKAMYGPYYYKVTGGWMVTPFGVWSKENWKLQGTTVDVKYKSHISPFAMFKRPVIR